MKQGPCSSLLCSPDLDEVASPASRPSQPSTILVQDIPALVSVKRRLFESTIERKVRAKGTAPSKSSNMGGMSIVLRAPLKTCCR